MRASLLLPLALLCALCVLPAFIDSLSGGDASTVLVSAANARAGQNGDSTAAATTCRMENEELQQIASHTTFSLALILSLRLACFGCVFERGRRGR